MGFWEYMIEVIRLRDDGRGYILGPIMENQMEKNMENEMETGIIR